MKIFSQKLITLSNMFFLLPILFLGASVAALFLKDVTRLRQVGFAFSLSGTILLTALGISGILAEKTFGPEGIWSIGLHQSLLLLLSAALLFMASVIVYRYVGIEFRRGILSLKNVRLYYALLPLFMLSVIAAILANSLIVLWISLEATTLSTAFLVSMYRRKSSLEAAWKYTLLSSLGTGLILTGCILITFALEQSGVSTGPLVLLSLPLYGGVNAVNVSLLKLAFVFMMVGFSTKMALVPLHAWLPDALSKAPTPIAGLIAGLLLPVSLVSLIRVKLLIDLLIGQDTFTGSFFLVFGLLSLFFAGAILSLQKNYKRMLAYIVILHTGLMVFGVGLGGEGATTLFLHLCGFSLLIASAFFLSGEIILEARSTDIENVKGLRGRMPITASLLLSVLILLIGLPPGAIFAGEMFLLGYAFSVHPELALLMVFGIGLAAISVMRIAFSMFFDAEGEEIGPKETRVTVVHVLVAVAIVATIGLGIVAVTPFGRTLLERLAEPFLVL